MIQKGVTSVLIGLLLITVLAVAASYYRYIVLGDVMFVTEGFSMEEE
jgi:hypothetical protein